MEILKEIASLKAELDHFQPMKREDEQRLWKKFRLEWNYNSNHIEGNTLTYGQTELLLIFDKAVGDHDFREFEEMKAHDAAIKLVQELASDEERPLTETFIRRLNEVLLVRPYWKEAITPDGQPTRRLIEIGEYKKYPNSVRLQSGEIFHYASPEETPALMGDLMSWYNEAIQSDSHPVEIAARVHYKLVRIHPFDDGNGRVARLLMNYVLLKNNYPPVIIKSADKSNYLLALNKADVGDVDALVEYIGSQLIWSLELSLKAAKGLSVDEPDDVDKEITLLKQKIKLVGKGIEKLKSYDVIINLFDNSLIKLIEFFIQECHKYDQFYKEKILNYQVNGEGQMLQTFDNSVYGLLRSNIEKLHESVNDIRLFYSFHYFLEAGVDYFNYSSSLTIRFEKNHYSIFDQEDRLVLKKPYHELLGDEEIKTIVRVGTKAHTDYLNQRLELALKKT